MKLKALLILLFLLSALFVSPVSASVDFEKDYYSFSVYKGEDYSFGIKLKNSDYNFQYSFKLNDSFGKLCAFDYVNLNTDSLYLHENEIVNLTLLVSVPSDFDGSFFKFDIFVMRNNEVIESVPVSLSVSSRNHWLEIEDVSFANDSVSPNEFVQADILVKNKGIYDENVKIRSSVNNMKTDYSESFLIRAGESAVVPAYVNVPDFSASGIVDVVFEVYNSYSSRNSDYTSDSVTVGVDVLVPFFDFTFKLDSHNIALVNVSNTVERTVLITNTGSEQDLFHLSSDYGGAFFISETVTADSLERTSVKMIVTALEESDSFISVDVCSLNSGICKTDSFRLKAMDNALSVSSENVVAVLLESEKNIDNSESALFSLRVDNLGDYDSNISVNIVSFDNSNFVVYPSDNFILQQSESADIFVYVTPSDSSESLFSVSVFSDNKPILDENFKIVRQGDAFIITAFSVIKSEPALYFIPLVVLVSVGILLFVRRRDGAEVGSFEKYYP